METDDTSGKQAGPETAVLVDPNDRKAVRRTILRLAGPSIVEMLLVNFSQMLNMIMVGHVGSRAVAAAGLTSQPLLLLISLFSALNIGTTVIVARSIGAGKVDEANRAAGQTFMVNVVMAFVLAVLASCTARQLLVMMGGTPEVVEYGLPYARIMFASVAFSAVSLGLTAILRGAGDTRTPMKINVISNILLAVLGIPLIYGLGGLPRLELMGAAVAAICAQSVSMIWVTSVMFSGKYTVRIHFRRMLRFDRELFARIWKIGMPALMEQLVMRFGMLVFIKIAASLGTSAIAATQITFNIVGMTFMPGMAFSMAASTLVGQALGANKPDLADKYGWQIRRLGMYVGAVVGIAFVLFPSQIAMLYTTEQEVIDQASLGIRIYGLIQISQTTQFILAGALRGAGDTKFPLYSTFIGMWGFRVAVSLSLVYLLHMGILGIWIAAALDQTVRSFLIYSRFKKGNWKSIRV